MGDGVRVVIGFVITFLAMIVCVFLLLDYDREESGL